MEGVNANLRHYIPTLVRRSRCFPRKLKNIQAVLAVFVQAYNRFGFQKDLYRSRQPGADVPFSLFDFLLLCLWTLPCAPWPHPMSTRLSPPHSPAPGRRSPPRARLSWPLAGKTLTAASVTEHFTSPPKPYPEDTLLSAVGGPGPRICLWLPLLSGTKPSWPNFFHLST